MTDRRVILYTKKLGGYEMNDHVYGLLTVLDYKKAVMYGSVTLAAGILTDDEFTAKKQQLLGL